jgi:hypothetical protein
VLVVDDHLQFGGTERRDDRYDHRWEWRGR